MSTGWSQADSQIQSTLWLQAHHRWLCRHSQMSWSPGRVGRGPKRLVEPASRPRQSSPAWGLLAEPREGLVAELSSQPRRGWWHWAPGAVPSVPRVTQVGLDCEGNRAMSSQRRVQRGQPAPLAVLLRRGGGRAAPGPSPPSPTPNRAFLTRESAKPSQKEASPQGLSVGPCAGA